MKTGVKSQIFQKKSQYITLDCLILLYDKIVSLSARLVSPLLYDMRNEQVCKIANITRRSVSLHIVGD